MSFSLAVGYETDQRRGNPMHGFNLRLMTERYMPCASLLKLQVSDFLLAINVGNGH